MARREASHRQERQVAPTAKPPARKRGSGSPLGRLRAICLALPETSEKEAWGAPTFRVRDKMFGMYVDDHHGDGRIALWCKAPEGIQAMLVEAAPERFFVPPYVGHKGWIGVRLDRAVDWDEIADLVADSYRMTAPARLRNAVINTES